jgi:hypothetical protein
MAGWSLKCNVLNQTPPDFPTHIVLTNSGPGPVPKGATVHWSLGNDSGDYTFTSSLARGATKQLNDVLSAGAGPGTACNVVKK